MTVSIAALASRFWNWYMTSGFAPSNSFSRSFRSKCFLSVWVRNVHWVTQLLVTPESKSCLALACACSWQHNVKINIALLLKHISVPHTRTRLPPAHTAIPYTHTALQCTLTALPYTHIALSYTHTAFRYSLTACVKHSVFLCVCVYMCLPV
jgi:hypothetical protein